MNDRHRDDRDRQADVEGYRSKWRRDEERLGYPGSSGAPRYGAYLPTTRTGSAPGYIGDGNYSSGETGSDMSNDYDYEYAGFKGDAGFDEYGGDLYGGGHYGQGPYEQSQQYGGSGFSSGRGPFGSLQRQYENRFVAGGHRGSYGDRGGFQGPPDYSSKQRLNEEREWRADAGTRRWDEGRYYDALSYDDRERRERASYRGFSGALGGGYSPGEFSGAPDWRDAPDIADPSAYRVFRGEGRKRRVHRGPKGYRRADERILEDIYEYLLLAEDIDSSDVAVEVRDGNATLTGTVPERWMKHATEDLVDRIHGVEDIDNRIRVQRPSEESEKNKGSDDPLRYSSAES